MTDHLLVLGHGYSSAATLDGLDRSFRVSVTARAPEKIALHRSRGLDVVPFDGTSPSAEVDALLGRITHLLITAAPDANGDPLLRQHRTGLEASRTLRWIGYLSTVGVYGNAAGGWVDETTPPTANSERARQRTASETAWLELGRKTGASVQIFRLGGIYGPGRNALLDVLAGTARRIIKPGQVFNRIHVEDIGGMVRAGMAHPDAGPIFNVVDGNPSGPQDMVAYAAELLQKPAPPEVLFEEANLSPMGRSFYAENRRVSNVRTLQSLGYRLRYPTYREGLQALVAARDFEREPPLDA